MDSIKDNFKYFISIIFLFSFGLTECDPNFTEIQDLCFHNDDLSVLQQFIDNSVNSGVGDDCDPYDSYCGSPNPYMDQEDAWFWVVVDGIYYQSGTDNGFQNVDGQVDPLELGLQEWENGRLKSLMCGAYIYCQLSGPIPNTINLLTEINVLRLEYNDLSGYIPEELCELDVDNGDSLEFDMWGNMLCPPYPECIEPYVGFQNTTDCFEPGDVNLDGDINVLDIVEVVEIILSSSFDYLADMNNDLIINVSDIVIMVNYILNDLNLPDASCYLEPDPGVCLAAIPAYYYNTETNICEMFSWGGCGGVVPFETLEDCTNNCE